MTGVLFENLSFAPANTGQAVRFIERIWKDESKNPGHILCGLARPVDAP